MAKIKEAAAVRMYKPFNLTSVCRADLEGVGYDTSKTDDATMSELANKMGEAIMEGFWTDMVIIADSLGIPKKN